MYTSNGVNMSVVSGSNRSLRPGSQTLDSFLSGPRILSQKESLSGIFHWLAMNSCSNFQFYFLTKKKKRKKFKLIIAGTELRIKSRFVIFRIQKFKMCYLILSVPHHSLLNGLDIKRRLY